jgi:hypothetical protein
VEIQAIREAKARVHRGISHALRYLRKLEGSVDMTSHRISGQGNTMRPLHMVAGAIAIVLVIGTIDYITGSQVSIAPLYLLTPGDAEDYGGRPRSV